MAVRSFRAAVGLDPNGGEQLVYQVPDDRTLIVKNLVVRLAGVGSAFIYAQAVAPAPIWVTATVGTTPLNQAETPPGFWRVLEAGDYITLYGDATLTVASIWLSGSLLAGDPS